MEQVVDKQPKTFTDRLRLIFKVPVEAVAGLLVKTGLKPNTVTILGLVGHAGAAALVATGHVSWGGILLIVMAPIDFLDGTMARMLNESSRFGAFVDSVTDRYSEFVIFGGLLIYFSLRNDWVSCLLIYIAVAASVLVSYIRARAETLNYPTKVGIMTRLERYLVLIPALVFNIPMVGVWIIAIFANITAIQRIYDVRRQAYTEKALPKN